uniref:Calcineurin subunit B n=1 Tax=Lygus hesperus TaxID=30085 RepID=A0A0A9XRB7_LYGHE
MFCTNNNHIDMQRFAHSIGLSKDSVVVRSLFRTLGNNAFDVNFRTWALFLSNLYYNSDDKVRIAFTFYDLDSDGLIHFDELCTLLKGAAAGANLEFTDSEVTYLCADIVSNSDSNKDGCIDMHEYQQTLQNSPYSLEYFSVDVHCIDSLATGNNLSFTDAAQRQRNFRTRKCVPVSQYSEEFSDTITLRILVDDDVDKLDI